MNRKKSLQYDQVLQRQRDLIYATRKKLLDGASVEQEKIVEIAKEKSQTSLIILTAYRVIRSMAGAVAERKIAIKIPIHSNTHPCLTDTFLTTSPTSWMPV